MPFDSLTPAEEADLRRQPFGAAFLERRQDQGKRADMKQTLLAINTTIDDIPEDQRSEGERKIAAMLSDLKNRQKGLLGD